MVTRPDVGSVQDTAALPRLSPRATVAIALVGVTGAAFAFVVALLGGSAGNDGLIAAGRAAAVFVPVAVGLHQWRSRAPQRYAVLLVLLGLWMVPVALAEAHASGLYSAGRVAGWIAEYLMLVVMLVFPAGVMRGRGDRALAAAMGAIIVLLYLPTALLIASYPDPSPVSTCVSACPANAFQVVSEPAFVGDAIIPLRETLTVLLTLAIAVSMSRRLRGASHLARLTLAPGLIVAVVHVFSLGTFFGLRTAEAVPDLLTTLGWLVFLSPAFLALALAFAEVRRRQYVANALEQLAVSLPSHATAASLRRGMATSLEDPTLQIVYHLDDDEGDGRWVDESGWPVAAPVGRPGGLTGISAGRRQVAAIIHDPWLSEDPALLAAAASYALVVL